MAVLHLVAASPDAGAAWMNCLRAVAPGDAILLLGNGVFCGVSSLRGRIDATCYALAVDVATRALGDRIATDVRQIDDAAFVDLVTTHHPVVSWS